MSDGGNDVVEERRKKRGDEESPRLNIRRYDNFSRQNPCSFLSRSPALASTNQISCCFFLYADLLRIVRQSSGTIAPHSNHCKVFRDNQKAPITPHIDITNAPSLGHLTHTCSSPRGNPPATNYPLLQLYISLYTRRDATFVFLSSFLLCHAISFSLPLIQYMLSLPNIPFIQRTSSPDIGTPPPLLSTPTLYKSAITAPTTPNNPTPTFTLPAAFFPVVLAALPAPELVVLGVPLPDVELALVFVPLALVVVIVL